MRILFIAFSNSIHAARWISQVADRGWELQLFSAGFASSHPDLRNITVLGSRSFHRPKMDPSVKFIGWPEKYSYSDRIMEILLRRDYQKFRQIALLRAIRDYQPDIIHSLEFQHAGYLALNAKERIGPSFPTWIATNWGSDIYYFKRIAEHETKIRKILHLCDYYSSECERDVHIARDMGFAGNVLPVLPNAGGIPIDAVQSLRSPGPISDRKVVIIKGYQGWSGRALMALNAIRLCKESLAGFTVVLYLASQDVLAESRKVAKETGITIRNLPQCSHEEMLRMFGKSRLYIGLGISDGISTSLLEAMVMGAFPIQSCMACVDEWIVDGKSGFIVPPEDPAFIAEKIQKALTDDSLVNRADEINAKTAHERLDTTVIQPQVVKLYEDVYQARKG